MRARLETGLHSGKSRLKIFVPGCFGLRFQSGRTHERMNLQQDQNSSESNFARRCHSYRPRRLQEARHSCESVYSTRSKLAREWVRRLAGPKRHVDVILSLLVDRVLEDHGSGIEFDQPSRQEEPGVVGPPPSLLHIVRHEHHRATLSERENQVFDFTSGDWIEIRTRFVEQ